MISSNVGIPRSSYHQQQQKLQQQQQLLMNKKTNLNQDLDLELLIKSSNNNKNEETKQDQLQNNNTIIDEDEDKPRRKSFDFIRRYSFGKESLSLSLRASRRKHASKKTIKVDELKSKQHENVPGKVHNAKEESRVGGPIFTKYRSNRSRRVTKRDSLDFVRRHSDENSFVPRQPHPILDKEKYNGMI